MYKPVLYHATAVAVYACILVICILAIIYGVRTRAYVKRQRVTALSRGFSPLDVQRIFIGKTFPRKLTRALIVHWAQMGYIRVEYVSRNRVKLVCRKRPPDHAKDTAVFFDRGTYVRERDVFNGVFARHGSAVVVNINKPLIKKEKVKSVNEAYASREDEGVFSSKHYKLKVATFILSFLPFVLSGVYLAITGSFVGLIPPFLIMIGLFVFRFIQEIPFLFRLIWSLGWVAPSIFLMIDAYANTFDPWGLAYASIAILFVGSYILVQFVDHREKNNLADYSDLVNYRKFLLFTSRIKLQEEGIDYYEVLPYLYAFNIKFLVKRKFNRENLPDWFVSPNGERGNLL
ncbi:MAG: DUF2207 domain-containing protein [Clostridia bacterium]|nr:DUF2207 domain-containing protein [Clostridia bacterium]